MNQAIGETLAFAVAISLSPFPIIGVVLMLTTPRGRANGPAFLVGWVVGLAAAGTVTLLVGSGVDAGARGSADGVSWARIVLGVLLLGLGARRWRGRPRDGETPKLPAWMASVEDASTAKAAGLGVVLAALNPKSLLLVVAAGLVIAQAGIDSGDQALALAVFVVLATIGPAIPVAVTFLMGKRADRLLVDIKTWMIQSNAAIMTVLLLVFGAKLIGDGIAG